MLFNWVCKPDGSFDLMLGEIVIGECYETSEKHWRVKSLLPGSGQNRRSYVADFPWHEMAKIHLEDNSAAWVMKAGLWASPTTGVQ